MIFRLGYVAMTLNLENCSPSGTVTLSNLNKLSDEKSKISRLKKVAIKNLENTLRILRYNKAYNIKVYRFTSKLVPLATHPVTESWNYVDEIDFEEFLSFLESVKTLNRDFDIMLEAKNKDIALLNLSGKLENVEGIKKINESEFELL